MVSLLDGAPIKGVTGFLKKKQRKEMRNTNQMKTYQIKTFNKTTSLNNRYKTPVLVPPPKLKTPKLPQNLTRVMIEDFQDWYCHYVRFNVNDSSSLAEMYNHYKDFISHRNHLTVKKKSFSILFRTVLNEKFESGMVSIDTTSKVYFLGVSIKSFNGLRVSRDGVLGGSCSSYKPANSGSFKPTMGKKQLA